MVVCLSRFVKQCETFLLHEHISCELFACECLPTLLQLARDKVPNVRIAIAKLLNDSVMSSGRCGVMGVMRCGLGSGCGVRERVGSVV